MNGAIDAARLADLLARLRARKPRVHCLLNTVVQERVADGLTALGAVPSMTSSPEEVAEFAARADALLVNLGTLTAERRQATETGVQAARAAGRPWVLDPVKCDVSAVRLAFARKLLAERPTIVKANEAERAVIEALDETAMIETGAADRLRLGDRALTLHNGHPWLAAVTGTGCLAGALVAGFAAVEADPLAAGAAGLAVLGIAAERAAERARGPGSFAVELLDALALLEPADLHQSLRIDHAGA
ncbi:putative hydroxyethylthiazole kinase [Aureimonas endophytica]|uniref:Hydroxyethylthiazole kinase n=1 Tax=Aureimonas endophytica TaxID=2027858 RepID=A0A916ZWV7_9HYPH|nr:hydroxyethylthiazole kinase [Aureimonas endophytica]GGE15420.1 putative hydroxyethylthiazole kinase [Aureimonas endophytica]